MGWHTKGLMHLHKFYSVLLNLVLIPVVGVGLSCDEDSGLEDFAADSDFIVLAQITEVNLPMEPNPDWIAAFPEFVGFSEKIYGIKVLWAWKGDPEEFMMLSEFVYPASSAPTLSVGYGEVWLLFSSSNVLNVACFPTQRIEGEAEILTELDELFADRAIGNEWESILQTHRLVTDQFLIQAPYEGRTHIRAQYIYQRGSQLYLLPERYNAGAEPIGHIGNYLLLKNSITIPLPSFAILITNEPPDDEDTIIYQSGKTLHAYIPDADNPWVYSYEFGSQIYLGNLPWVYVPDTGYIYPAPSRHTIDHDATISYQGRWCYKVDLGWFFKLSKYYPLPVDENRIFHPVEFGPPASL